MKTHPAVSSGREYMYAFYYFYDNNDRDEDQIVVNRCTPSLTYPHLELPEDLAISEQGCQRHASSPQWAVSTNLLDDDHPLFANPSPCKLAEGVIVTSLGRAHTLVQNPFAEMTVALYSNVNLLYWILGCRPWTCHSVRKSNSINLEWRWAMQAINFVYAASIIIILYLAY